MRTLIANDPGFGAALAALLAERAESTDVTAPVAALIARVRAEGDAALVALTAQFDRFSLTAAQIRVSPSEIAQACAAISADQHQALALAAARIEAFHAAQMPQDLTLTDAVGARMGLRWGPLDSVGLYVPGGKASYPSSVLMNAIPARVAGVARIAMCVPTPDGQLNPLVLAAAQRAGVSEIYRIGGAQAIAALAYGTATIAPVDRITGPGNAYVAEAKRQVFGRVGIDNIAGPSEVAIIADATQNPDHIALDLLAQAEHDEAAQAILLTDNADLARRVATAIEQALRTLPRAAIARRSIEDHGAIILVDDLAMAATLSNQIAPEHLQIMTADPDALFAQIRHAGAVFLGRYTPEAIGDYIAGPNHVLPTSGTARFASGLSVFDFLKRTSWVALDAASLRAIGPAAVTLADAEGLGAHASSVAIRLGQNHP
ncbi:MAG TPA: histidinol dehydrogenase [Acidiphilium sp.]|nr:MAG: histidinol dehydrogenase [Acidiphilium sp. 21-60-14]OYV89574.1 MAG: histidinol dehydrogenase [Acidiphilium sp. 37-60-79]OZB39122.1 MAG: histidinol dehydrogenase [Acidiphilium sp. 34-60-192]HQT88741.1 histidinol dehydrogenase [Acidiphilium sp.]HQU23890.1 histidinol dehydrogenase [Acidiphilium sp.]